MGTIFIVMPKSDDANRVASVIRNYGLMLEIEICASGAEVLRLSRERDSGVVICPKRVRDMGYSELAEYLPESFGIIVLTNDASLDSFSNRVVKLMLPLKSSALADTIEMMTGEAYRRPRKPAIKKRSEADQLIIDKAKKLLMDRNGMTEPEAFRYIQKSSMDSSRSMVESAQMILLLNSE